MYLLTVYIPRSELDFKILTKVLVQNEEIKILRFMVTNQKTILISFEICFSLKCCYTDNIICYKKIVFN